MCSLFIPVMMYFLFKQEAGEGFIICHFKITNNLFAIQRLVLLGGEYVVILESIWLDEDIN